MKKLTFIQDKKQNNLTKVLIYFNIFFSFLSLISLGLLITRLLLFLIKHTYETDTHTYVTSDYLWATILNYVNFILQFVIIALIIFVSISLWINQKLNHHEGYILFSAIYSFAASLISILFMFLEMWLSPMICSFAMPAIMSSAFIVNIFALIKWYKNPNYYVILSA